MTGSSSSSRRRSRSRSPSRRSRDRDSGDRRRSRQRGSRSRSSHRHRRDSRRSRSRSRRRSRSSSPRRRDRDDRRRSSRRSRTPEPPRVDRSEVTVFVSQLHPKVDERDLFEFFSLVGKVVDIRLIRDARTQKSKGLCYVEFADVDSVLRSAALSGQLLRGFPITVQVPNVKATQQQPSITGADLPLLVTHIHPSAGLAELETMIGAFGELLDLQMGPPGDAGAQSAIVQYRSLEDARTALAALDQLEFGDRRLSVCPATQNGAALVHPAASEAAVVPPPHPSQAHTPSPPPPDMPAGEEVSPPLDAAASAADSAGAPNAEPPAPAAFAITPCLYYENMLSSAQAQDPDFVAGLVDEVRAELSRFGELRAIHVVPETARVYVRFGDPDAAQRCHAETNGRYFAQRTLAAHFCPEEEFDTRFP